VHIKLIPRLNKPFLRSKESSLRYGIEELKFLRSLKDVRILVEKAAYLMPRKTGALDLFMKAPPILQIEPTNYCNVNCICCPTARSARSKGYMYFELFQHIIDEAAQIGVKRIRLFLHGESMLHPQVIEMMSYIKKRGLAFHLYTNGMAFDKDSIEAIMRSDVTCADHITFSILGHSKEVYESIMRGARLDRVSENISTFLSMRKELDVNGPVIETIFYRMPENEHEEAQYVKHWRSKVDHARLGGEISFSFSEYKKKERDIPVRTQTCSNLWEKMTVFWNGDVPLCCQDVDGEWILGNLEQDSIKSIWNGEQLLSVKRLHKERKFEEIPLCAKCDM
jgi:radical SAM protein with 4Fe4S-binding SPASM domain